MITDISKTLMNKRDKLIKGWPKGRGLDFLRSHSDVFDEYFLNSIRGSKASERLEKIGKKFSIIALGGYGRKEQCLHSDIDILFLFESRVPNEAEKIIQEVIYPLWDLQFEIGHATRSVKDCISLASNDFEILTSLLDARYVTGNKDLYLDITAKLRDRVVRKKKKKILSWLLNNNCKRHELYGNSAHLLEPNLKEGLGGLRDYHSILWMSSLEFGLERFETMRTPFNIPEKELLDLSDAVSFIWNVRNLLHQYSGRKCDRLYFEYHSYVSEQFQLDNQNLMSPVEKFISELHGKLETIRNQYVMLQTEMLAKKKSFFVKDFWRKQIRISCLAIQQNEPDSI